jgi:hypothetical protein
MLVFKYVAYVKMYSAVHEYFTARIVQHLNSAAKFKESEDHYQNFTSQEMQMNFYSSY